MEENFLLNSSLCVKVIWTIFFFQVKVSDTCTRDLEPSRSSKLMFEDFVTSVFFIVFINSVVVVVVVDDDVAAHY